MCMRKASETAVRNVQEVSGAWVTPQRPGTPAAPNLNQTLSTMCVWPCSGLVHQLDLTLTLSSMCVCDPAAAWYTSFPNVAIVIYLLRTRRGIRSLPVAINERYGSLATLSFGLVCTSCPDTSAALE